MSQHQHQWVKHIVVPVDVISDPMSDNGAFYAIIDENKLQTAESTAVFGCAACSEPLSAESVDSECLGADKAIDASTGSL